MARRAQGRSRLARRRLDQTAEAGRSWITSEEWTALPETMEVRLVRTRGTDRHRKPRTLYLATTLLDPGGYLEEEIAALYAER